MYREDRLLCIMTGTNANFRHLKWNIDWIPSLKLGHEKLKVGEASVKQCQGKARKATECRKRMVEKDAEMLLKQQ